MISPVLACGLVLTKFFLKTGFELTDTALFRQKWRHFLETQALQSQSGYILKTSYDVSEVKYGMGLKMLRFWRVTLV